MSDAATLLVVYKFIVPILIACIGGFLGLGVYWLKKMSTSLDEIKEIVVKHAVHIEDFDKRIEKLETFKEKILMNGQSKH